MNHGQYTRRTSADSAPRLTSPLWEGPVLPLDSATIKILKDDVITEIATWGEHLKRTAEDSVALPNDFRLLLPTAAPHPDVHPGSFSIGVRVGTGATSSTPSIVPAKAHVATTTAIQPSRLCRNTLGQQRSAKEELSSFPAR